MSLPTHTCTRCGLPTHTRHSRYTDCIRPYAQETAMPAQRVRTLTRPGSTDEHVKGADWRAEAACKDADPTLFFQPDGSESPRDRRERIADAKSYCDRCPVITQCEADGWARQDAFAILGRLTPEERNDILRARRGQRRSA